MTIGQVTEALQRLSEQHVAPTMRNVHAAIGSGSMRDVARLLRDIAAAATVPTDDAVLPPPAEAETPVVVALGEPWGTDEDEAGLDAPDDDAGAPPARTPSGGGPRRSSLGEVCHLCGDFVPHEQAVIGILSLLPSVAHADFACAPLHLYFHAPGCLARYADYWNKNHPNALKAK